IMSEIWIKLIPNDTLFFRTGRPFTMGSENWSDVIFPPYPSTIYGALRTFLLFHREGNLSSFYYPDIGSPNEKGSLQLFGPILCEKENTSFF
ncbi:MAG: type III-B CRISPR module-associated Cmr3 family protein, partial [Candidatus Hydrothermales bacterium]